MAGETFLQVPPILETDPRKPPENQSSELPWLIQLGCEANPPRDQFLKLLPMQATKPASALVRRALASAVLRIGHQHRLGILEGLLSHSEDAQDHNLPLMYWYGLESILDVDSGRALEIAS